MLTRVKFYVSIEVCIVHYGHDNLTMWLVFEKFHAACWFSLSLIWLLLFLLCIVPRLCEICCGYDATISAVAGKPYQYFLNLHFAFCSEWTGSFIKSEVHSHKPLFNAGWAKCLSDKHWQSKRAECVKWLWMA